MSNNDTTIERRAKFEALTHPTAEEFIILDTAQISGYEAAHVAEKHGDTWRDYWSKTQYLADEANLGASKPVGKVSEEVVATVEAAL